MADPTPRPDGAMRNVRTFRPVAKLRQGRTDWYRIENKAAGAAELYIYDEIGYFGVTAAELTADLQALDVSELTVHINSPGGEVFDGIAIFNALKQHKARVTTINDSLAASICSVIFQAGDTRIMSDSSTMMIHEGSGLCVGNAADMRQLAALLDKTSDNIASIYATRAGGELGAWRDAMRAETWYNPQEAVAAGLADEVATSPVRASGADSWDLSLFNYSGRASAPEPVILAAESVPDVGALLAAALQEVFK